VTRRSVLTLAAVLLSPAIAHGQMAAVEAVQSVGASTESIASAGVQFRGLAEPMKGLRLRVETAWGDRSEAQSDVFGTAYPYGGRFDVIEAYGEWLTERRGLRAVKAGRYRTPFGLYNASDHAYLGFLLPPLIRYGEYWGLSAGYLEHGVDVLVGVPQLSLEMSIGRPGDVGEVMRRPGWNSTVRAEGSAGPWIVGASFVNTTPYEPLVEDAPGRTHFGGIDARWMRDGVQFRGEWLFGQYSDFATTTGGYFDTIVHTPAMGRVTALGRIETINYDTIPPYSLVTHRYSAAARVRAWQGLSVSLGITHQGGQQTQESRTAVDLGITWALRQDLTHTQ